jgi:hypothetical protein
MRLGEIARFTRMRLAPCWRKQKWPSEGAAKAHLRSLLRAPFVKDKAHLGVYICPHCRWYHVGRG